LRAVNGVLMADILDVLSDTMPTDGAHSMSLLHWAAESFALWYLFAFGPQSEVTLPVSFERDIRSWIDEGEEWRVGAAEISAGPDLLQTTYDGGLGHDRPDPSLVYSGRAYLLISGETFSGGAEFASLFHMADRGPVIGQEVGGAITGSVSGFSYDVALATSRLSVSLPVMNFAPLT
jgi:hypothetical protein